VLNDVKKSTLLLSINNFTGPLNLLLNHSPAFMITCSCLSIIAFFLVSPCFFNFLLKSNNLNNNFYKPHVSAFFTSLAVWVQAKCLANLSISYSSAAIMVSLPVSKIAQFVYTRPFNHSSAFAPDFDHLPVFYIRRARRPHYSVLRCHASPSFSGSCCWAGVSDQYAIISGHCRDIPLAISLFMVSLRPDNHAWIAVAEHIPFRWHSRPAMSGSCWWRQAKQLFFRVWCH